MRLYCVNCWAVYLDEWSGDEVPVCPYCGVSHYEETELPISGPRRRRYSKAKEVKEVLPLFWQSYAEARRYFEKWDIDEDIVHRKALAAAKSKAKPSLFRWRKQAWLNSQVRKKEDVSG